MIIAIISLLGVWTIIGLGVMYRTRNTKPNLRTVVAMGPILFWIGLFIFFYLLAVETLGRWVEKRY